MSAGLIFAPRISPAFSSRKAHPRSPHSPRAPTPAVESRSPAIDFKGYRQTSLTLPTNIRAFPSSNPQRVGAPVLDGALDVAGLRETAFEDFAHDPFQLFVGGEAQRDGLRGRERGGAAREVFGQELVVAQVLFEPDDSVLR